MIRFASVLVLVCLTTTPAFAGPLVESGRRRADALAFQSAATAVQQPDQAVNAWATRLAAARHSKATGARLLTAGVIGAAVGGLLVAQASRPGLHVGEGVIGVALLGTGATLSIVGGTKLVTNGRRVTRLQREGSERGYSAPASPPADH